MFNVLQNQQIIYTKRVDDKIQKKILIIFVYVYQELHKQDHPLVRVTEVDKYKQRESNFLQTAEGDKIEVLVSCYIWSSRLHQYV